MIDGIVGRKDGDHYYLSGKEVSEAEYRRVYPEPTGMAGGDALVAFKPVVSESLAVHPDQVNEAREDAKRKGVPVEFKPNGQPVFTSSRQMREYARVYGFRHRGY